jgi:quinol monooxygenase YgiN
MSEGRARLAREISRGSDPRVALMSRMTAKPGREDELVALILGFYDDVRESEPGCLTNIMHRGVGEARAPSSDMFAFPVSGRSTFIFYEVYADQDAAQRHPTTPHFARMVARLADLIDGPVHVEFLDRVGGHETHNVG